MTSQRDLLLIEFPFSSRGQSKVRPVIVVSNDYYNNTFPDFIAIPLTSNLQVRNYVVKINNKKLESGRLNEESRAKVDNISCLNQNIIIKKIARINTDTLKELKEILLELVS